MQSDKPAYSFLDVQRDFVSGSVRGAMLGFSWGLVTGAYAKYDADIATRVFLKRWMLFTTKATVTFIPIIGVSSIVYKFCKALEAGETASIIATIGVSTVMFDAGRRLIYYVK